MSASSPISESFTSGLRAPLSLCLIGLLIGLTLSLHLPHAPPWLLAALSIAFTACALLRLQRLSSDDPVWKVLTTLSCTLLACCWGLMRIPSVPTPLLELPPREVNVRIRIERVFPVASNTYLSAIATITDVPSHLSPYRGQTIYLTAEVPLSTVDIVPGIESAALGVLQPVSRHQPEDFEQFLLNQRVFLRLRKATLYPVASPPLWSVFLERCQQRIIDSLRATAFTPQAAHVPLAMLLGRKDFLQSDWKQRFILTGIMHLFAVSGMHVGIIAATTVLSFRLLRLSFNASLWATAGLLIPYILMIGAPPSAVRAGLLFLLFAIASAIKRQPQPFSALVVSAVMVLIFNPLLITHPGFQLSYSVVAALFLMALPLRKRLRLHWKVDQKYPFSNWRLHLRQRAAGTLIDLFTISLAASLSSAPLIAVYFGNYSFGSIALNMLVVPIASLAIVVSVLLAVAGLFPIPEALLLPPAVLNSLLVESMLVASEYAAEVPFFFHQSKPLPSKLAAFISGGFFVSLLWIHSYARPSVRLYWYALPALIVTLPLLIYVIASS